MIKDLRTAPHSTLSLSERPEVLLMVDALCSFEHKHIILQGSSSNKINLAFIQGLLDYSSLQQIKAITEARFIYCCSQDFTHEQTLAELEQIKNAAHTSGKMTVLVTDHPDPLSLNLDPSYRIILINNNFIYKHSTSFAIIRINDPSEAESIELLKSYCTILEKHHTVTIPPEIISLALTLASHYLPGPSPFDRACELLDSACTRTRSLERPTVNEPLHTPIITSNTLVEIVSNRTRIPSSHLQNNKFQATQFSNAIAQHIFGQEGALSLISSVLQQGYVKLHENPGPLCSFLFCGQADTGKTEFTLKMAQYLFGHDESMLQIMLDQRQKSLVDIPIINNSRTETLLEAIQRCPYAIILIDDIQAEQMHTLSFFNEIFARGYVVEQGQKYDFSHAIIIMTTRLGSESVSRMLHPQHLQEQNHTPDLLQLVLNESVLDIPEHISQPTTQELCTELTPILEKQFPSVILQKAHIVPFVPLGFGALEKIMRIKIKDLIKRLNYRFGIELNYAPEIIKFLAHEAYWRKTDKSLAKLLEQLLYSCITHELLNHNYDKHRSHRLLLQLQENGHSLRCELLTDSAVHRSNY